MAAILKTFTGSPQDDLASQEVAGLTNAAVLIQDGGSSGTVLHNIVPDNLLNTAKTYLKIWDSSGSPAVDTLEPDIIIPIAGKKETVIECLNGLTGIFTNPNKMYAIATPTLESGNTLANVTQNPPTNAVNSDFVVATS